MLSVIIVDDELLVRIGLKKLIDWNKLGMVVVGEAQNGAVAYELYKKEEPDIILTDIKMPIMDGLQLISKLRESDKKTKIIILTCYQEFELVHQAIKLGVSDYILKLKMSANEMESVICKVREEILNDSSSGHIDRDIRIDKSILKEQVIKNCILNKAYSDAEFQEMAENLQIRLSSSGLVLCVMKIISAGQRNAAESQTDKLMTGTVLSAINALLDKYKRGEIIFDDDRQYLLLFSFGDIDSENIGITLLYEILDRITNLIKTYFDSKAIFGISNSDSGFQNLGDLYEKAMLAIRQSFFYDRERYIHYGALSNLHICQSSIEHFGEYINGTNGLENEYKKEILSGISLLKTSVDIQCEEVRELFIRWVHWTARKSSVHKTDTLSLALGYADRIRCCDTLAETIDLFTEYLQAAILTSTAVRLVNREVSEAIQFIEKNYHTHITLEQVAEQLKISANYLSRLFTKELNISFTYYIIQARINRAKELLTDTHMKTYEIAHRVGFTDESYFSRVFKKSTGIKPNEYRKLTAMKTRDFIENG